MVRGQVTRPSAPCTPCTMGSRFPGLTCTGSATNGLIIFVFREMMTMKRIPDSWGQRAAFSQAGVGGPFPTWTALSFLLHSPKSKLPAQPAGLPAGSSPFSASVSHIICSELSRPRASSPVTLPAFRPTHCSTPGMAGTRASEQGCRHDGGRRQCVSPALLPSTGHAHPGATSGMLPKPSPGKAVLAAPARCLVNGPMLCPGDLQLLVTLHSLEVHGNATVAGGHGLALNQQPGED